MKMRRVLAVTVLPVAVALAGCSSSATSGSGKTGSGGAITSAASSALSSSSVPAGSSASSSTTSSSAAPSSGVQSSGGSSAPAGSSAEARALVARVQAAMHKVTSAQVNFSVEQAGQSVQATGSEKLAAGKPTAIKLDFKQQSINFSLIYVDTKTYVKLPPTLNKTGKPYILARASSKNAVARALASSIGNSLSTASINSYTELAQGATAVSKVGTAKVGSVSAQQYHLTIDVAKLPADSASGDQLRRAGLKTIPLDLYLDDHDRTVLVVEKFTIAGKSVQVRAGASEFDKPVSISAPPASQVSTD